MKNDMSQEDAAWFFMERRTGKMQPLQLQGYLKIYGVAKGKVVMTVSGEERELTEGQMAIVDRYETHSYRGENDCEMVVAGIGIHYFRILFRLYPNKKLVRWLMDGEYNCSVFEKLDKIFAASREQPMWELNSIGSICQLFSELIAHYGLEDRVSAADEDLDLTSGIIQYINMHYSEKITLEHLAKEFHLSPTALSKKLGKQLGVDLRVFVNNIRIQKAVQMMEDPAHKGKTMEEIAFACGFCSLTTFYRNYKRYFHYLQ